RPRVHWARPAQPRRTRQDGRDTPTSGQEALTIPSRLERALIGLESRRWSRRGQPRGGPLAEEGSDMLSCTRGGSDQRTRTGDGHPGPRRPGSIGHREHRTGSWKKVTLTMLPGKPEGPPWRRGGAPPQTVMYQSAIARGGPDRARTGTPVWRPRAVAREAVRDNGGRSPTASGRGASAGWRGVAARPARAIVPTRRSDPKADWNRRRPRPGFPASSAGDGPEWRRTR